MWNTDDPNSDIVLAAGLSVASALCTRARLKRDAEAVDFASIDAAIRDIERQLAGLDEITKLTGTIQTNSEKVINRASLIRAGLEGQIETLDRHVQDLQILFTGNGR